jgi:hypothetical protein
MIDVSLLNLNNNKDIGFIIEGIKQITITSIYIFKLTISQS